MSEAETIKALQDVWDRVKFDPPTGNERIWDGFAWLTLEEFNERYGQDEEC